MEDINKEIYQKYDRIISKTLINLYSAAKSTNEIFFKGISKDSLDDLCLLQIAKLGSNMWGYKVYTNLGFWGNHYLTKKLGFKPRLKKYHIEPEEVINCFDLENFVAESENETVDVYSKIYKEYYEKGK